MYYTRQESPCQTLNIDRIPAKSLLRNDPIDGTSHDRFASRFSLADQPQHGLRIHVCLTHHRLRRLR